MQKAQRRTPRTHFRMTLQEQRSTSNKNKRCPLTNRCRKVLLQTTAAPVMGLWLLQAQLPVLLLFSGLQRPTAAVKVNFNLAPESFDDQYQGCSQQVMEELRQGDYFTKELETRRNYSRVWHNCHLTWLNRDNALPENITITHAVAILVYTSNKNIRSDFTKAMTSAARSPWQYKHSFHFKYLHYYLTSAIQLLRKNIVMKNDSLCYEVHYEADYYLEAYTGATIRFGHFLSSSLLRKEAQNFGNQTLFTIFTCLGAPVEDFSLKKEVLVPPYEVFKVVNMSYHSRGNWLQLRSTGNLSTYNCQLLKGENWGMQITVSIYRIPKRNSRKLEGFYILCESNRKIWSSHQTIWSNTEAITQLNVFLPSFYPNNQ